MRILRIVPWRLGCMQNETHLHQGDLAVSATRNSAKAESPAKATTPAGSGAGNTAKLGCSPLTRSRLDDLGSKLASAGIDIEAAEIINEMVRFFDVATGYLLAAARLGTLVGARMMIDERVGGEKSSCQIQIQVARAAAANPFASVVETSNLRAPKASR